MLDKLGIQPLNLAAQIVNFAILFYILKKFLYKPILNILDERAKKIAKGLKAAEETIQEREKLDETKAQQLKKTKTEMEQLLKEAQQGAKETSDQIIQKAREEAKKQAEKEFLQMQQRLRKEEKALKGKMAKIAVDLSKKILKQSLDKDLQKKILSNQVKKIKTIKG